MSDNEYKKDVDHLAIGLTKSPMFMGVNIRLFFANMVICTLICIDAHTFMGVPLFVVLHLVMVRLSIKDPNFLTIQAKSFLKTPPVLNFWYWGKTISYEPW
jgi:type IV secretory pathway VirB3-like protein